MPHPTLHLPLNTSYSTYSTKMSSQNWNHLESCADMEDALTSQSRRSPRPPATTSSSSTNVTQHARSRSRSNSSSQVKRTNSIQYLQIAPLYKSKKSFGFSNLPRECACRIFAFLDVRTLFMYVLPPSFNTALFLCPTISYLRTIPNVHLLLFRKILSYPGAKR